MGMRMAQAVRTFAWGKATKTKSSKPFAVEEYQFRELAANGLVVEAKVVVPPEPAGEQQSVSPAGQASPNVTASKSAPGATPTRRRARSSAQTPPTD